ncbi:hypothetical protein F4779DRAFT_614100 [Xylariaceae sp. FL0662B]|nr:hypothetical protein F4779DRAFT_614100 [Xylariaceae sp. FL0662B]
MPKASIVIAILAFCSLSSAAPANKDPAIDHHTLSCTRRRDQQCAQQGLRRRLRLRRGADVRAGPDQNQDDEMVVANRAAFPAPTGTGISVVRS